MKLNKRIKILIWIFVIQSVLHFIDGIGGIIEGFPFQEFMRSFVYSGVLGYLAYTFNRSGNRDAYWVAVVFTSFVIIRFVIGISILRAAPSFPLDILLLGLINLALFGIIPMWILLRNDIRQFFLKRVK